MTHSQARRDAYRAEDDRSHGRRQFTQITPNFPEQCRHVLEALGEVYHHDRVARERGLARVDRLHFHQQNSKPVMDDLHQWFEMQLSERRVEPNSGLGKAIDYMLRHWQALTLFLRELVFYCEQAAGYCQDVGYQDEGFFDALVRMFEQALKSANTLPADCRNNFIARLNRVRDTSDPFGYGVADDMHSLLAKYVKHP